MYRYICGKCGAHLDPGEDCDCAQGPKHLNMYQRTARNYVETESEEKHDKRNNYRVIE